MVRAETEKRGHTVSVVLILDVVVDEKLLRRSAYRLHLWSGRNQRSAEGSKWRVRKAIYLHWNLLVLDHLGKPGGIDRLRVYDWLGRIDRLRGCDWFGGFVWVNVIFHLLIT